MFCGPFFQDNKRQMLITSIWISQVNLRWQTAIFNRPVFIVSLKDLSLDTKTSIEGVLIIRPKTCFFLNLPSLKSYRNSPKEMRNPYLPLHCKAAHFARTDLEHSLLNLASWLPKTISNRFLCFMLPDDSMKSKMEVSRWRRFRTNDAEIAMLHDTTHSLFGQFLTCILPGPAEIFLTRKRRIKKG